MTTIQFKLDQSVSEKIENIESMMQNLMAQLKAESAQLEADRFLRINEVSGMIGFNKKWIYEAIQKGRFPSPIKFGTSSRWRLSEVKKWIDSQ